MYMKIAIDARLYGPVGTGIGRYLQNLLRELAEIDKETDYVILLRKSNFHLFNPSSENFKKVVIDTPWYSVREQISVPAFLYKEKPDLVHFPHINVPLVWPGKYIVTVHDLTVGKFGGRKASTRSLPLFLVKNLGFKIVLNQALRRAQKILVPSKYVGGEVEKNYRLPKSKVEVIYESVEPSFADLGKGKIAEGRLKMILSKYGIKTPYLIYVGSFYPHKNLEILLESLNKINQPLRLVLVGKRDKFVLRLAQKVRDLSLETRVVFTGFVPDDELALLLRLAKAFVYPSASEGFGLPGLEAMSLGCPVIAAKATALPEIYAGAALYFDPSSAKDLATKITTLLDDQNLQADLKKRGLEQIKKYSWRELALKTLAIYREVLATK